MQGYTRYRARVCKGVRSDSGAFEGISMIYDSMRQARKTIVSRPHHAIKSIYRNTKLHKSLIYQGSKTALCMINVLI